MRILIVSQYFWPENFRVNDLAIELRNRGHEVVVLTGIPNYPSGAFFSGYGFFSKLKERWNGIDIIRMPLIPRGNGGGLQLALNYLSFALLASLLSPFRCRGKYDVIFVHEPSPITVGLPAIVMKFLTGAPVYFWVLDLWPESLTAAGGVKSPLLLKSVSRLVRFIYGRSDKVLVQSKGFIEPVRSHGIPSDKIAYFPSWAEELYHPVTAPASFRSEFGLPEGFYLMFAGNVGAAQDFESILSAAERLKDDKDIHWLIVGDGRMSGWVSEQVKLRGLRETVHILGRHPVERMPEFFAAADAMLVTLKSEPIFALTIPGKVQSYLACGRPIVSMLDGEGGRVVEEAGAGYACASGDAEALAELVLKMANLSAAEREAMGSSGRHYYEKHFERDHLLSKLESWMTNGVSGVRMGE